MEINYIMALIVTPLLPHHILTPRNNHEEPFQKIYYVLIISDYSKNDFKKQMKLRVFRA